MKQLGLLACLPLLVCCSRAGENPLPVEPLLPRSEYDIEASNLKIAVQQGGPHRQRIKVGADVWIVTKYCNVGLQSIPGKDYRDTLEFNGRMVRDPPFGVYRSFGPLVPGQCIRGETSHPAQAGLGVWYFRAAVPGRYEFKYRVHLKSPLEEENLSNNEFVVVIEVEQ